MRIVVFLFGLILLLPGICSAGFIVSILPELSRPGASGDFALLSLLWLACFAVSAGGVLMIRYALRKAPPSDPPTPSGTGTS